MALGRRPFIASIFALCTPMLFLASGSAKAAEVGLLECDVAPGIGLIITSSRALSCLFTRVSGPPDYYVGTINNFGLSLGATGPGHLVWAVFAASPGVAPGALAGSYGGASANVSFGPGFGANALVGGGGSFGLQPLSINAQVGVDVTAGITGLTLEPAPGPLPAVHHRHYHYHQHYY